MIKKLLLILSFIALVTIAFSKTTYAAQEGQTIVVTEELAKLNELYKEGVITEEEFSKAKSILLNIGSTESKIKNKKQKLTAAERKQLKEAEQDEKKALKEQLRAERKAEKERILEERSRIIEEKQKACSANPKSKGCKQAKAQIKNILERIKMLGQEVIEKEKKERALEREALRERKARIKKERELEKQARLEEQEKIKAKQAARKAERQKRKAEWKKACADDPESKVCKEGKPSEKIKNVLKKIEKKLGG